MKKSLVLLIAGFLVLSIVGFSQEVKDVPIWKKMHYLSEEEMKLPHDNMKNFTPTDPPNYPVRMVGEYEKMQSVLIRYPFGIPNSLITEMSQDCGLITIVESQSQQNYVTNLYTGIGVNMDNVDFIMAPTDSYWTRDYGPWFVIDGNGDFGVCDFPYNRPRPNDDEIPVEVAAYLGIDLYGMPLSHTGGNWMCTGLTQGASTDLVWEENLNLTQEEIQEMVDDYLGVAQYHVLPDPLGEYIKHIDCWGKFLAPNKVLLGSVLESDPRYEDFEDVADYFATTVSDWGVPYEVYRVYTPGYYPNTPYTNSLILNEKIFVPITGSQYDSDALAVYEQAMPGYEIIGVMYDGWENTDALHCRTKGIADIEMLHIKHMPLLGNVQQEDEYDIVASITNYSGSPIYSDSVLLYYRVDGGSYQQEVMTQQLGAAYGGEIPYVEEGSVVEYYIYAADESGRSANHPFIGAPDPHEFTVVQLLPGLLVEPDTLVFDNGQQAGEGLKVHIYPDSDEDVLIDNIELYGIHWWAEPTVDFPYLLSADDSLILTVYVYLITDPIMGYVKDSLYIECEAGDHEVTILINDILLSSDDKEVADGMIMSVYPNPFENVSYIRIEADHPVTGKLAVYNMQGQMVNVLADGRFSGKHTISWDGSDMKGSECPAGIYYMVFNTGKGQSTCKLIKK